MPCLSAPHWRFSRMLRRSREVKQLSNSANRSCTRRGHFCSSPLPLLHFRASLAQQAPLDQSQISPAPMEKGITRWDEAGADDGEDYDMSCDDGFGADATEHAMQESGGVENGDGEPGSASLCS